ncbi:hypothetical protein [Metallibacterium scheffleri]|uniref:hypothetical protein n=1 Tax=Metallibacterium scheffleri TaxID=993689 RepID=UPI0010A0AF9C|nr:hypothetical protein [Metallibacterium scheffleri]
MNWNTNTAARFAKWIDPARARISARLGRIFDLAGNYTRRKIMKLSTNGHHSTHIIRWVAIVGGAIVAVSTLLDAITPTPTPTPTPAPAAIAAPAPARAATAPAPARAASAVAVAARDAGYSAVAISLDGDAVRVVGVTYERA